MKWHPPTHIDRPTATRCRFRCPCCCTAPWRGLRVYGVIHSHSGDSWGGPGGSVTVGLVGNVPAIPLPHPEVPTTSRVVDNSKGLYKAEPPKIEPPPPDALPIPKFKAPQAAARK